MNWNFSTDLFPTIKSCHPLYEDVNWNQDQILPRSRWCTSSSIWGCELKCFYSAAFHVINCHPLYEDVNWNGLHPEDLHGKQSSSSIWGCELKWVHIKNRLFCYGSSSSIWGCELKYRLKRSTHWRLPSSSIWGCELKYKAMQRYHKIQVSSSIWGCELKYLPVSVLVHYSGHPLYEDVNWNGSVSFGFPIGTVILYMRMWIEISIHSSCKDKIMSSSIWGCELKYTCKSCGYRWRQSHPLYEDVNWNTVGHWGSARRFCHPLYEDVNWNEQEEQQKAARELVILYMRMWIEIIWICSTIFNLNVILYMRMWIEIEQAATEGLIVKSSSIWGCELKYWSIGRSFRSALSSSIWGCELK